MPGRSAQFKMTSYQGRLDFIIPENAQLAAVLVLFYEENDQIQTVFIERNDHKDDKHSGQISFPGGKKEASDSSMERCALRETYEEIGVGSSNIEVLGRLTSLYIPVSNFHVFPVVGIMHQTPTFTRDTSEVKSIIQVPVKNLLHPEAVKRKNILTHQQRKLLNVPYFDIKGKVIWGATAMILGELVSILEEVES